MQEAKTILVNVRDTAVDTAVNTTVDKVVDAALNTASRHSSSSTCSTKVLGKYISIARMPTFSGRDAAAA